MMHVGFHSILGWLDHLRPAPCLPPSTPACCGWLIGLDAIIGWKLCRPLASAVSCWVKIALFSISILLYCFSMFLFCSLFFSIFLCPLKSIKQSCSILLYFSLVTWWCIASLILLFFNLCFSIYLLALGQTHVFFGQHLAPITQMLWSCKNIVSSVIMGRRQHIMLPHVTIFENMWKTLKQLDSIWQHLRWTRFERAWHLIAVLDHCVSP